MLQDLKSVRKIVNYLDDLFEKKKIYKLLGFKAISLFNSLIISIPNDVKNMNPLHQDIYAHYSKKYLKIWAPISKVSKKYGSMQMFKGSHKLGFIEPKYKNKKSTYPEIDKRILAGYNSEVFKLNPGSLVIFNPLITHKSIKNVSNKVRFTIGMDIQDIDLVGDNKLFNKMMRISQIRSKKRKKNYKIKN